MKLSYDFDIDDLNCFQRYHYGASPTYRRIRTIARLLLPVALLLLFTSMYLTHGFDPLDIAFFGIPSVVWFVLYPRLIEWRMIRQSNKLLREGRNDSMFGRRDIELFPDKIHIVSPASDATYRASAITKVVETSDQLLLYVSSIQALILPRRKLSPEDFQQAAAFAREHYASQAT